MDKKLKKAKERVESSISDAGQDDAYEVEYWRQENEEGVEMHGLDLVFTGSYVELFYEPVDQDWKDYEDLIRYISGVLFWDAKAISEIQEQLPDRHDG